VDERVRELCYYGGVSGDVLTGFIRNVFKDELAGDRGTSWTAHELGRKSDGSGSIDVSLVSFPASPPASLTAPSTISDHYENSWHYVQLIDVTGAIEWLGYDHIALRNGTLYFMNRHRVWGGDIADLEDYEPVFTGGSDLSDLRGRRETTERPGGWPAGSALIPVQRGGEQHRLETGDRLTVVMSSSSDDVESRVITVAHTSKRAGFSVHRVRRSPTDEWKDRWRAWTSNYFALTEQLSDSDKNINRVTYLAAWPGWSPVQDLSPRGSNGSYQDDLMLWIDALDSAWGEGGGGVDDRRLYLGSEDDRASHGGSGAVAAGLYDRLSTYRPPSAATAAIVSIHYRADDGTDENRDSVDGTIVSDDVARWFLTTDRAVSPAIGLASVMGEVVAYRASGTEVQIIGRGLLGSEPAPIVPTATIRPLAIGPVGRLAPVLNADDGANYNNVFGTDVARFAPNDQWRLRVETDDADPFRAAPCFLLAKPDGSDYEIAGLVPDGQHLYAAPWLRGLYNGPVLPELVIGTEETHANTLIIAWWPRYPSMLPKDLAATDAAYEEHMLRCRQFAFANFPLRYHDMYLLEADDPFLIEPIDATFNPANDFIVPEVRILDWGFDWRTSPVSTDLADLTAIADAVTGRLLDGLDLRVHWRYDTQRLGNAADREQATDNLLHMQRNAGIAPSIGAVTIRAHAPTLIFGAEQPR
ncbi:MAG: hypothetical protein ACOCXA_04630, partial [Planctomycetota bacterium]